MHTNRLNLLFFDRFWGFCSTALRRAFASSSTSLLPRAVDTIAWAISAPSALTSDTACFFAVIELVPAATRVCSCSIQSLSFFFAISAIPIVCSWRWAALETTVPLIPIAAVTDSRRAETEGWLSVLSFARCYGSLAVFLIWVSLWRLRKTTAATIPMSVSVVSVVISSSLSSLSVFLGVLFFLLQALDDFLKSGLSCFVIKSTILLCLVDSRFYQLPRVGGSNRWFEVLDSGTKSIDCTTSVPIGCMFLLFVPLLHLVS